MKKYGIGFLVIFLLIAGVFNYANRKLAYEIELFIAKQERYVREKDVEKYIETISHNDAEYVAEKESWIRDISKNDIQDYNLHLKKIKRLKKHLIEATIQQSYSYKGKFYYVEYPLLLQKEMGQWKDCDLNFKVLKTEHFIIKYFPSSLQHAQLLAEVCEEAYENVASRYGEAVDGLTTIKIYKDLELLRQSVKLSFAWQFAGWYEYPEAIKTTEFKSKGVYRRILEHELIHKLTLKKANNNLPYWFTEGLAVYFTDFFNGNKDEGFKEYYLEKYGQKIMDIFTLEQVNLEKLQDDLAVSNYYDSAGMIVQFMVDTYGLSKIKEIVTALGQFAYQEGTGSEVDKEAQRRFRMVIPKVLGKDIETLNREWKAYIYSR